MFGRILLANGAIVVGAVAALAAFQVSQPWRGVLVGWSLFLVAAGACILKLGRRYEPYPRAIRYRRQGRRH